MKRLILFLFGVCLSVLVYAQDATPDWVAQIGGSAGEVVVQSVAIDAAGNVYLGGYFKGSVNFNPASSGSPIGYDTNGNYWGFVAKYGSSGTPVWVKPIESDTEAGINAITIDASGNVYFTGYDTYDAIIDGYYSYYDYLLYYGDGSDYDILLGQFDDLGNIAWFYSVGSASDDEGYDIAISGSSLYLTGDFGDQASFDNSSDTEYTQGGQDAFLASYDLSGNFNWARTLGSADNDYGESVAVGTNGIYVGGVFYAGNFDVDVGGADNVLQNDGGGDGFVARFLTDGSFDFAYSIASTDDDEVRSLAVRTDGSSFESLYVGGTFSSNAGWVTNDGASSYSNVNKNSNGGLDAFVAKYDAMGIGTSNDLPYVTWIKTFGGTGDDYLDLVRINQYDQIFASGAFQGDVDFNQGESTAIMKTADGLDGYLMELNSNGATLYAEQITGQDDQEVAALGLNYPDLAIGGLFHTESTVGVSSFTAAGDPDGFVGRFITTPYGGPTDLILTGATDNSFDYSFDGSVLASGYLLVRKANSAPGFVPQNGIGYTDGEVLPDGSVVQYAIAPSSGTVGSLYPGIDYHVQVYAYNNDGNGGAFNYYKTPSEGDILTTGTALTTTPTSQPSNLQFDYNGGVYLTVSFDAASDNPTNYLVLRDTSAYPTYTPTDGTDYTVGAQFGDATVAYSGSSTSFEDDGAVLDGSVYYYSVYSYNYSITPELNRVLTTSPLQGHTDDTSPDFQVNQLPESYSSGQLSISAQITDAESNIGYAAMLVSSPDTDYANEQEIDPDGVDGDTFSFTIPAADIGQNGVLFYFYAKNGAGIHQWSDDYVVPHTTNNINIPFDASGTSQSSYRIISVPVVTSDQSVNGLFGDNLGTADKSKWRMFHYQGGSNVEMSGGSQISAGAGYWLISSTGVTLDVPPGTTQNASYYNGIRITLQSGWNEIGNPYLFDMTWDDILTFNQVNDALDESKVGGLRTYNGSWNDSDVLPEFGGAFVFSSLTTDIDFYIPDYNNQSGSGRKPAPDNGRHSIDSDNWQVLLSANNGDVHYDLGGFGMNPAARADFDQYDEVNLPRFMDYIEIDHKDKSVLGYSLSKDIVPTEDNHIWEFTVDTNGIDPDSELKWDNTYFGNGSKELVLWDEAMQKPIDMRTHSDYLFNQKVSGKFKVLYGSEDFIKENTRVNNLLLRPVFPNPVADHMTVSFSLPTSDNHVDIALYDMMGQRIQTVAQGQFEDGYHEVQWSSNEGQRPTSGLYLLQIRTNDDRAVQRVVFK